MRERRLARELREARVGAQLPGSEVARLLGWSASKVSRIETGHIGISLPDLDRLVELYRLPGEQSEYLRRLAPATRIRGWWDAYADSLSPDSPSCSGWKRDRRPCPATVRSSRTRC